MLSGPVGAGKTTVARALVTSFPGPLSYIEGDMFWSFIAKPKGSDRRENFRIIMRAMTAAALPFVRSGYDVLIDFSIPPEFLKTARTIVRDMPLDYVVLRPSQVICEARAAGREEGKIVDYARYREFYALFDAADRYTIHDDEAGPEVLAARIREGLSAGRFRVA